MPLRATALPPSALGEQFEGNALDDQPRHGTRRIRAHLGVYAIGEADDAIVLEDRRPYRRGHAIVHAWEGLDHQTSAAEVAVAASMAIACGGHADVGRHAPHARAVRA